MDWYKATILVMCLIVIVSSPVMMVRAFRRRDKGRIFDMVLSEALLAFMGIQTFWPNLTARLTAPIRWLLIPLAVLFIANMFGLSRWLFKTPGTKGGTPSA